MNEEFTVDARFWIEGPSATFLGEGRVQLLKEISETGSINEASKRMNMSYKKALKLIETMNNQSKDKLVISNSGGKGGGGTIVTDKGKRAIQLYSELNKKCKTFLTKEFKTILHEF